MIVTFPSHAEPLVRAAILAVVEKIPLGGQGPMMELRLMPLPFREDELESDTIPAAHGCADEEDE